MIDKGIQLKILTKVIKEGECSIAELKKELSISSESLLDHIASLQGLLPFVRNLDGERIVFLPYSPPDPGFFERLKEHTDEKAAIAKYVRNEFVKEGETIFIGSATTGLFLALEIFKSPIHNLKVVVHNLFMLQLLWKKVSEVWMIGGRLNRGRSGLILNPLYDLSKEDIQKSFIGFDSFSTDRGFSCNPDYVKLQRDAALNTSELIVLIGDHSKIGKKVRKPFLTLKELRGRNYILVTDDNFKDKTEEEDFEENLKTFPKKRLKTVEMEKYGPTAITIGRYRILTKYQVDFCDLIGLDSYYANISEYDVLINLASNELIVDKQNRPTEPQTRKVFWYLLLHLNDPRSKKEFSRDRWDQPEPSQSFDGLLRHHISEIRKVIRQSSLREKLDLTTEWGSGYTLKSLKEDFNYCLIEKLLV